MTRRIALLRGVNVGGRNKLPMKDYVAALEGLGCTNVRTYIQSGNAVFDGDAAAADVAERVFALSGVRTHAFVLPATALANLAAVNPFARQAVAAPKSVLLLLLERTPQPDAVEALAALKAACEDFALAGAALFLHAPAGLSGSRLALGVDRALGTRTTARNWNTVEALIAMSRNGP